MYAVDTIAAIATAPGRGGIGIIRISGPASVAILERIFTAATAAEPAVWPSHHLILGEIRDAADTPLDQGLAVLMRHPHSFTGEDVAELHCHGGPVLLQQILTRVLQAGARLAAPGEFTKRAFLNGRLDLSQAEAVVDAINARTPQAARLAVQQLTGALSQAIDGLTRSIIRLKALLEAQIDFSEEYLSIAPAELLAQLSACQQTIADLRATYRHGRLVREGVRITIVGKPNAGKSSLLNALLGEDRAIVTPLAGTTRDVIEESIDLDGIPLLLADTAGVRELEVAETVERIGIERTLESIDRADLQLVVMDRSTPLSAEDIRVLELTQGLPRVLVLNKSDLPTQLDTTDLPDAPRVAVSARDGSGLTDLRRALHTALADPPPLPHPAVVTRARHEASLVQAADSLALARRSIEQCLPADVIAVDVQDALDYLGEIVGTITHEDVLDTIFREFCIGK